VLKKAASYLVGGGIVVSIAYFTNILIGVIVGVVMTAIYVVGYYEGRFGSSND
jgi:hypothetical protein